MAYATSKTSAMQTALKAAVDIAAAELGAGLIATQPDVNARIDVLRNDFFGVLEPLVQEDQAKESSRPARSGGGLQSGGAGAPFSIDDAKTTVLNFGAFKGLTLGEVVNLSEDEAKAYSGGRYQRSGMQWLKWAAGSKEPKMAFVAKRAAVLVTEAGETLGLLKDLSK